MKTRRMNWPLWAGFLLSLAALGSYPLFFAQFLVTRVVPWVNFLMFGAAAVMLIAGLRCAFWSQALYRGKIVGPVLTVASMGGLYFFTWEGLARFTVSNWSRFYRSA